MPYALRRILVFPLVMFGVAVFVFVAIRLVPGDAITAMLGTESGLLTDAQRAALEAYFGLDQNWLVQFWRWLAGVVQGDFGISTTFGKPVMSVILAHFPLTLELAVLSMLVALGFGLPAGIFAAIRKDSFSDLAARVLAMIGQSTPNFVMGLLLIFVLSVGFGVLPTMGSFVPLTVDPISNLTQMILPALTLGTAFAAAVIRISRSAMLDILHEDYVRTARSKGMTPRWVIWRHALPNALISVVILSGVEFGYLLGGAVLAFGGCGSGRADFCLAGPWACRARRHTATGLRLGAGVGPVHCLQFHGH